MARDASQSNVRKWDQFIELSPNANALGRGAEALRVRPTLTGKLPAPDHGSVSFDHDDYARPAFVGSLASVCHRQVLV
jgi:hypothetical protein